MYGRVLKIDFFTSFQYDPQSAHLHEFSNGFRRQAAGGVLWIVRSQLSHGWPAGWLAEIFFTQDQNPAQAATLWDPWGYELLHHLGATTLAACVSRKLTGMEGAPKRSRSRPPGGGPPSALELQELTKKEF